MGTRRMEAKVDLSLLPSDAARFFRVLNEFLVSRSDYVTDTDLDRLLPLLQDGSGAGDEWSFRPLGVNDRACSPSDEGYNLRCLPSL